MANNPKISQIKLTATSYDIDVASTLKDLTPTEGSTNVVTSDGIRHALNHKFDKIPDGENAFLDINNKINPYYISDTILGQLKFGGILHFSDHFTIGDVADWYLHYTLEPSIVLSSDIEQRMGLEANPNRGNWYGDLQIYTGRTPLTFKDNAEAPWFELWMTSMVKGSVVPDQLRICDADQLEGYYFIVAASTSHDDPETSVTIYKGLTYTDGDKTITYWPEHKIGDWILSCGGIFTKVDNTDTITHIEDESNSLLQIVGSGLKLNKITDLLVNNTISPASIELLPGCLTGSISDLHPGDNWQSNYLPETHPDLYNVAVARFDGAEVLSSESAIYITTLLRSSFGDEPKDVIALLHGDQIAANIQVVPDPRFEDLTESPELDTYTITVSESSVLFDGIIVGVPAGYHPQITVVNNKFLDGISIRGSVAEGINTTVAGVATHAEGWESKALYDMAHAEGYGTEALGQAAHSEGVDTHACAKAAHAEGLETWAEECAHAEGHKTRAENYGAHAEGNNTKAANTAAHAEGNETTAFGPASHVEGHNTRTGVQYENGDIAGGSYAHAEGDHTVATGQSAHAEGGFINDPEYGETFGTALDPKIHIAPDTKSERQIYGPFAAGVAAHAEGIQTLAYGYSSHAEGFQTEANSRVSHAEGSGVISGGYGWRIIGPVDANAWKNGTNTITIYDPRKTFLTGDDGVKLPSTDAAKKSAEGYICSVKLNSNYDLCGYIMSIDSSKYDSAQELTITLDVAVKDTVGLTAGVGLNDKANDQNTLRVFKGYIRDITAPSETTQHNNAIKEVKGGTICVGTGSHAEGLNSMAFALAAHAEGRDTKALGTYSHAEGRSTLAVWGAHSEGQYTYAIGLSSHAEGRATRASGDSAHSEGVYTTAANSGAHAEGSSTQALALYGHSEGQGSKVETSGTAAHAEGGYTQAKGVYSHSEGYKTGTGGHGAHAEGTGIKDGNPLTDYDVKTINGKSFIGPFADGRGSHAEGAQTWAGGYASHSEGIQTEARSIGSHAEGYSTLAGGLNGDKKYAHAEGWSTKAQGDAAHAEGKNTLADSEGAHAEGTDGGKTMTKIKKVDGSEYTGLTVTGPTAWSKGCHAEGICTFAANEGSHAEGIQTQAVGYASHAGGIGTRADKQAQTVVGQYNAADSTAKFIVGCGSKDDDRFNCFSTGKTNEGQAYITVGSTTLTEDQLLKLIKFINAIEG